MHTKKIFNFTVTRGHAQLRIDCFLASQLKDHSRSFCQKLIDDGLVTVNKQTVKASYKTDWGDSIIVEIPPPTETNLKPEVIPLDILYDDPHLIVINKPAGLVVHPGAGVREGTLVNALLAHCKDLSGVGGRQRPGIVHRLDKDTSGLLVVAKDDPTHIALQRQFSEKTARREYKAILWGRLTPAEAKLETLVNRSKSDRKKFVVANQGKSAITYYRVETYFSFLTLVNAWLKTGRTHQLRIHFKHLNHPILGDPEYAGRQKQINRLFSLSQKKFALYLLKYLNRQALHAFRLGFEHPIYKKWMEFSTPLPDDFAHVLKEIKKYEDR